MSYFIYNDIIQINQLFTLSGEEAKHLLCSRRIQLGESVEVQDIEYNRFQTTVKSVSKRDLVLQPLEKLETPPESPLKINLFQALIKDKNLELILQKTTELGVSSIYFFPSFYSQRLKKHPENAFRRWDKICLEACKQSGRKKPPTLSYIDSLNPMESPLFTSSNAIPVLLFDTGENATSLSDIEIPDKEVHLLVGPEGGWQQKEITGIQNMLSVNLGRRILRAETAAIAAVTLLQYLHGDLN